MIEEGKGRVEMSSITINLQNKSVGDTEKGELYRIPLRQHYATCVTIETQEGKNPLIGIIDSREIDRPSYLVCDRSTKCVSFGTDWILEPVFGDESYSGNMQVDRDERILFVQGGDALLRFDRIQEPNSFDCFLGSIMGSGRPERTRDAVPFIKWKIWQSAAERLVPNAIPLVSFPK